MVWGVSAAFCPTVAIAKVDGIEVACGKLFHPPHRHVDGGVSIIRADLWGSTSLGPNLKILLAHLI